jgi:hypothetical protein
MQRDGLSRGRGRAFTASRWFRRPLDPPYGDEESGEGDHDADRRSGFLDRPLGDDHLVEQPAAQHHRRHDDRDERS